MLSTTWYCSLLEQSRASRVSTYPRLRWQVSNDKQLDGMNQLVRQALRAKTKGSIKRSARDQNANLLEGDLLKMLFER
jgi:hypothetical protein